MDIIFYVRFFIFKTNVYIRIDKDSKKIKEQDREILFMKNMLQ